MVVSGIDKTAASSKRQGSTVDAPRPPHTPLDAPSVEQMERTVQVIKELKACSPHDLQTIEESLAELPEAGDDFLGFRLLSELGRGAFGRVFLAQQMELADRPVALKIAPEVARESDRLARLQHTNIVPIHSVYLRGRLQAICMPYLGVHTLRDLIVQLRSFRQGHTAYSPLVNTHFTTKGLDEIGGILTVAIRLAEGLMHAHARDILHCDLKPANVLFSDDGQPMLLDFNLSHDIRQVAAAAVGGTLPYMPPEQLRGLAEKSQNVDARSDLYSVGVILFELLTGQMPFPTHASSSLSVKDRIANMLDDRRRELPSLRNRNPKVTPALEAIVHRLLAPEPCDRYQSAHELHTDLQRQLAHQPLRYAPNRSLRERWTKFRRRNPRLTSTISFSVLAIALLATLGAGFVVRNEAVRRWEARDHAQQLASDRREIEFLLTGLTGAQRVDRSLHAATAAHDRFDQLLLLRLPPHEQEQAKTDLAEVLYLKAYGHSLKAQQAPPRERAEEVAAATQTLTALAELRDHAKVPRAVVLLHAELARLQGRSAQAEELAHEAEAIPAETGRDLHLLGVAAFQRTELQEACAHLEESLRRDPSNFNAWFLLGVCRDRQGDSREAVGIFSTCIALQPNFYTSYFNRGLAYLHMGRLPEARHDFTECLRLQPRFAEAYLNRSLTYTTDDEQTNAESDLTEALQSDPESSRLHLLRARVRQRLNEAAGAAADRERGLALTPVEPVDWVTRGMAKLPDDPKGALADYDEALQRDPRYLPALQNKGALLIRYLKQIDASIDVLSATITLYPDDARARAGRGILLARQGKRQQALDDAEVALAIDGGSAPNLYQVAGIYAQTSKQNPEDAAEAFRLLGAALRQGFGFEHLEKDTDLDPIRNQPRFERTIRQARERLKNRDD